MQHLIASYTETSPQTDDSFMTLWSMDRYSHPAMNGLDPSSAFIIQFRTDTISGAMKLAGRIEHVVSGKTAIFKSIHEVPELLRQMLKDSQHADVDGV
jgi:hypothetical protein